MVVISLVLGGPPFCLEVVCGNDSVCVPFTAVWYLYSTAEQVFGFLWMVLCAILVVYKSNDSDTCVLPSLLLLCGVEECVALMSPLRF